MQRSLLGLSTAPLRSLWLAYERQLQRRPVLTQMTTSAVLWGSGDLMAQAIERSNERSQAAATAAAAAAQQAQMAAATAAARRQRQQQQQQQEKESCLQQQQQQQGIDWRRAGLTAAFGAILVGSIGHFWYIGIDRFCGRFFARSTPPFIAAKVALDTAVMGPFYVAAFFAFGCAFIDGGGMQEFRRKMQVDFVPTLAAEVTFWPIVQTINFAKVPLKHQLLVVNAMTVLDAAFMSWARNRDDWLGRLLEQLSTQKEEKAAAAAAAITAGSSRG